jgi:hypothetical protein
VSEVSVESDRTALGLYVVLARDACDFIDMVIEETDVEALKTLYLMLTTPNPNWDPKEKELNDLGGGLVKGSLEKRGVALPSPVKTVRSDQESFDF